MMNFDDLSRGNNENPRSTTLKVRGAFQLTLSSPFLMYSPGSPCRRRLVHASGPASNAAAAVGRREADHLAAEGPNASDRTALIFYADEGG